MTTKEVIVKNNAILPKYLYHLVPEKLFAKFIDTKGNYDSRHQKDWGGNSSLIHTTPTKKQLKEKVADVN